MQQNKNFRILKCASFFFFAFRALVGFRARSVVYVYSVFFVKLNFCASGPIYVFSQSGSRVPLIRRVPVSHLGPVSGPILYSSRPKQMNRKQTGNGNDNHDDDDDDNYHDDDADDDVDDQL